MQIKSGLTENQTRAAKTWANNTTEELLYGGAKGGGKSYLGATLIFGDALMFPGTHYFIARKKLVDLKRYTMPTISEVFEGWGLPVKSYTDYREALSYYQVWNGSRVYLIDCKYLPSDPDFSRFGSMQFTRGWIEEGAEIEDDAIINLGATVGRWKNLRYRLKQKQLITTNPTKGHLYRAFYDAKRKGDILPEREFIPALPDDNPFLSQDYIKKLERLPPQQRARLRFGDWDYEDNPDALVSYTDILNLQTNNHAATGETFLTADIALDGSDRFVIWVWNGWHVVNLVVMDKSDGPEVLDKILKTAQKYGVKRSNIAYDAGGVGGAFKGFLRGARPYYFNGTPEEKEQYRYIKDQHGYRLAQRIRRGEVYLACNLGAYQEILDEELGECLVDGTGGAETKLRLRDKREVKKRIGRSPDLFDAFVIRESLELKKGLTLRRRI